MNSKESQTKQCNRCKLFLYSQNFSKHIGAKDGLKYTCKTCIRIRARELFENNFEINDRKRANRRLKRTFGITLEQYEVKLKQQDYKCAICGERETVSNSV